MNKQETHTEKIHPTRIFKEIGHADELGSGTRNLIKYGQLYSDQPIELIEGDIFKTIVHVADQASDQVTDQAAMYGTMHADTKAAVHVTMQATMQVDPTSKSRKYASYIPWWARQSYLTTQEMKQTKNL